MKKSTIPLTNNRRRELERLQLNIDQLIHQYIHQNPTLHASDNNNVGRNINRDNPISGESVVEKMEIDDEAPRFPFGLANVSEFFSKLEKCVDYELSTIIRQSGQNESSLNVKDRIILLQNLLKTRFKTKWMLRKSYSNELRQPNCNELKDQFVRENQIQVLLSFMFLYKLKSADRINKKKLDMIFGLLGNCHSFYYDESDMFEQFLRRTLLFEPLISHFPKIISTLFKKFVLKVPNEVQTNVLNNEEPDVNINPQLSFTLNTDDQLMFEDDIILDSDAIASNDNMYDSDVDFRESATYEELMANMRKNPDFFNRRLHVDTPTHIMHKVISTPFKSPAPSTTYKKAINTLPTPDLVIGSGKKRNKRKLFSPKKVLPFSSPVKPEMQTPKRQKLESAVHVI